MAHRKPETDQFTVEGGFLVFGEEAEARAVATGAGKGLIPLEHVVELRREAAGRYRVVIDAGRRSEAAAPARIRVPGSAKGLKVPDDFDAPLDDFREYT